MKLPRSIRMPIILTTVVVVVSIKYLQQNETSVGAI